MRLQRQKAAELIREQQQGLGRPIMAMKFKDQQMVGVGDTVFHSPEWKTMADFLSHYIKTILGGDWGSAEILKPYADRHPIMQWYHEYCLYQKNVLGLEKPGEVKSSVMTGVVYCYMGLAYSLFLLKNNAELQDRLIKRLKDPKQFQGAYYEVMVANNLIRAGFELILEDETDDTKKHCEYAAVSKKTGKKYWVECKMRAVEGVLGKTKDDGTAPNSDPTGQITKHINDAFGKPAQDERMIFVDVNVDPSPKGITPPWTDKAAKRLDMKEKDLKEGQASYIFVTNIPFHRVLHSDEPNHVLMAFGLGIPDFGKEGNIRISELHRRKMKHSDAHAVIDAFNKYPQIPATFDGSLPSSLVGKSYDRIMIGETYHFTEIEQDGLIGTVTAATVSEDSKEMIIAISTNDGHSHLLRQPMSEEAFNDYKAHPEAFFGVVQHVGKRIEDPYDLFLFYYNTYKHTPKEKLLEFLSGAPDISNLKDMSQEDLALEYSERLVGMQMPHLANNS